MQRGVKAGFGLTGVLIKRYKDSSVGIFNPTYIEIE